MDPDHLAAAILHTNIQGIPHMTGPKERVGVTEDLEDYAFVGGGPSGHSAPPSKPAIGALSTRPKVDRSLADAEPKVSGLDSMAASPSISISGSSPLLKVRCMSSIRQADSC